MKLKVQSSKFKIFFAYFLFTFFCLLVPKKQVFAEEVTPPGGSAIPVGPKIVCTTPNTGAASPFEQVGNTWSGDCTPTEVIITTFTLANDPDLFESILEEMIANGLQPVIRISSEQLVGNEWQLPEGGATQMSNAGANLADVLNKYSGQFCGSPIVIPFNEPNLPDEMGGLSGEEAARAFAQLVDALINGIIQGGGKNGWQLFFPPLALDPGSTTQQNAIDWLNSALGFLQNEGYFDGAGFTIYGENPEHIEQMYDVMYNYFKDNGIFVKPDGSLDILITEVGGWANGSPLVDKETFTALINGLLEGIKNGSITLEGLVGILVSFFVDTNNDGKADLTCFVYFESETSIKICCYDSSDPDAMDDPSQMTCIDCYVPNLIVTGGDDDCPAQEYVRIGDCSGDILVQNAGFPLILEAISYGDGQTPRPECEALLDCTTGLGAIDPKSFACREKFIGEIWPDKKFFEDQVQEELATKYELGESFVQAVVDGFKSKGIDLLNDISEKTGVLARISLPFMEKKERSKYAKFFQKETQKDTRSVARYYIKPTPGAIDPTNGFAQGYALMSDMYDEEKITEIWCRSAHAIYSSISRMPPGSGLVDVVPFDCEAGRPSPKSAPNTPGEKPGQPEDATIQTTDCKDCNKLNIFQRIKQSLVNIPQKIRNVLHPALAQEEGGEQCELIIANVSLSNYGDGVVVIEITFDSTGSALQFNDMFYEVWGPQGKIDHCSGILPQSGGSSRTIVCGGINLPYELNEGDKVVVKFWDHQIDPEKHPECLREVEAEFIVPPAGETSSDGSGTPAPTGLPTTNPPWEKDYCVNPNGSIDKEELCISSAHARVQIDKVTKYVSFKWPSPIAGLPDCTVKARELIPFAAEEWTQYPMLLSIVQSWMSQGTGVGNVFMPPDSPGIKVQGNASIWETNKVQLWSARAAGVDINKLEKIFFTEIPFRWYTERIIWKPLEGYLSEVIPNIKQDYYAAYGIYEPKKGLGDEGTTPCDGTFCPLPAEGEEPGEMQGEKADVPIGVVPRITEGVLMPPNIAAN